jgi:hypothetical protein
LCTADTAVCIYLDMTDKSARLNHVILTLRAKVVLRIVRQDVRKISVQMGLVPQAKWYKSNEWDTVRRRHWRTEEKHVHDAEYSGRVTTPFLKVEGAPHCFNDLWALISHVVPVATFLS